MKKSLLTLAFAVLAVASTQAQGLVVFASGTQTVSTNNSAGISGLGGSGTGKTVASANTFYYALFVSTSATTVNGSAAAVSGIAATNLFSSSFAPVTNVLAAANTVLGRWSSLTANGSGADTVAGIAGGANAQFVYLGWSANLGTSLSALETSLATPGTVGFIGQSAVGGTQTLGDGNLVLTPNLSGAAAPGIAGFTLGSFAIPIVPTPEPATLALAGLSGASLLLFRRRK
jgi:hypothetical protein